MRGLVAGRTVRDTGAGGSVGSELGRQAMVLEQDDQVGGIARTVVYRGYRFDIGGHRFFSKSQAVVDLWNELLPDDFIQRPRMSRIYYEGKFYSYPLRAFEALRDREVADERAHRAADRSGRQRSHELAAR